MIWEIVFHREFEEWFFDQAAEVQASIGMVLDVLEEQGAGLGRPYVDTLKGSAYKNMKELRVQHDGSPYRILFAFVGEASLKRESATPSRFTDWWQQGR